MAKYTKKPHERIEIPPTDISNDWRSYSTPEGIGAKRCLELVMSGEKKCYCTDLCNCRSCQARNKENGGKPCANAEAKGCIFPECKTCSRYEPCWVD